MAVAQREAVGAGEMLRTDHQKVKELFRKYAELGDRAHKSKLEIAEKVFKELEVHSRLEEEIFYPAAREVAEEQVGEVVAEGYEEHHVVDILIQELRGLNVEDEAFDAKFKVLMENVEHHIQEEEEEMLPAAERKLRDRLEALGEEMRTRKEELLAGMI
jgi:hemerythrin-like domain-containing protein